MGEQKYRSSSRVILILCYAAPIAFADADTVTAAVSDPSGPTPTPEEAIAKMRVKTLKEELKMRGLECQGCAEKEDLKTMLFNNWWVPKKEPTEKKDPKPDAKQGGGQAQPSQAELDEIIKKMKGDYSSEKDPEKRKILERLKRKGMSFSGGSDMDVEALRNLEKAMGHGMGRGEL